MKKKEKKIEMYFRQETAVAIQDECSKIYFKIRKYILKYKLKSHSEETDGQAGDAEIVSWSRSDKLVLWRARDR
jgi:hypothetical protein